MEQQTRQRIVGALLLVFMGVLLAPLLLRSPDEVRVALDLSIPDAPAPVEQIVTQPVTNEDREQVRENVRVAREELESPPEIESGATEEQGSVDPEDIRPGGWAVQVASFESRENARLVVTQLENANYRAFLRQTALDGNTLYRVFIGPEINRDRAEALLDQVGSDPRFKYKGLVVPFTL